MFNNSGMCNNFQVSIIMNIFNRFKPKRILDSSAGWGDRLIAACSVNKKYTGVDPSICMKNNYKDIIQSSNINHLLYEARDCCKKTIEQKKIIHMIIKNYQIDNKNYSFLSFSLLVSTNLLP